MVRLQDVHLGLVGDLIYDNVEHFKNYQVSNIFQLIICITKSEMN